MPFIKSHYYRRLLLILGVFAFCATGESSLAKAQSDTSGRMDSISIPSPKTAKGNGGLDKPIDYKATDSIIFDLKNNKVFLFNEAELEYGSIHLTANYIEVNIGKKEIFARGGFDSNGHYTHLPVLKDGDDNYTADSMRYNSGSKKGRVYGLRLVQDEAYIHLSKVLKLEDGSFVGEHGKITTCNEDHPHFYFNTNKIKVIPNNKVFFGSANLVVEDIPTPLAIPFGLAPIKKGRRNGILFPGYGYNQANKSFYLQNFGYYTGLGPNMDLTLSSDAYLNGDLRIGVSTNIVKKYKYRANLGVNGSWFGNGIEVTSPEFKRNLDFSIRGDFGFDSKFLPGTVLNGNLNIQTGNYNKLNSRSIGGLAQNQYNSGINYGRNFFKNRLNLTASARHSQNTADHSFRLELPSVSIGLPGVTPFGKTKSNNFIKQMRFSYNLNFNNILNTKDTLLFSKRGKEEFKNMQNGISHSLPISTNFKMLKGILNISPSVNYTELWYFKSVIKSLDTNDKVQSRDTSGFWRLSKWGVNTSITTNIYGTYLGIKRGKLRAIRHTITPTVSIGYNPGIDPTKKGWTKTYKDTGSLHPTQTYNIFEKGIFGSYNQVENGYIGFGINNNLQAKKVVSKDSTGKEQLEKVNLIDALSINGSYNMLADSFKFSDIAMRMNTVLMKIFNISMNASFSPYAYNTNKQRVNELSWKYNKKPVQFQNFGVSLNTNLNPETFRKKKPQTTTSKSFSEEDKAELADVKKSPDNYYNFNIPWTISLRYIADYNNLAMGKDRLSNHRISFSGDLNITPEWKIGYSSGYDLKRKELSSSQITVTRNLHCWMIDFSWIPSGYGKQWVFTLRPKSGLLQDLKLNKRAYSNPAFF